MLKSETILIAKMELLKGVGTASRRDVQVNQVL